MKIIVAIIKLIISVILQALLIVPKIIKWCLGLVITILVITSRTISFLIVEVEGELKENTNGKTTKEKC